MGPTVCELEGPIPIENRSRAETNAVTPQGYVAARAGIRRGFEESCAARAFGRRYVVCVRLSRLFAKPNQKMHSEHSGIDAPVDIFARAVIVSNTQYVA
jgi:hypothetical protein